MARTSDARARLTEAALGLIWEKSYGSASVDGICDRAGVNKGSLYHYFDSKCELAIAALEDCWQKTKMEWDTTFSPSVPPLERLRNHFASLLQGQSDSIKISGHVLGCPMANLGCEVGTLENSLRIKIEAIFLLKIKYLESALRDAVAEGSLALADPAMKARQLWTCLEGSLVLARILNNLTPLRELHSMAFDLLGVPEDAPELTD